MCAFFRREPCELARLFESWTGFWKLESRAAYVCISGLPAMISQSIVNQKPAKWTCAVHLLHGFYTVLNCLDPTARR